MNKDKLISEIVGELTSSECTGYGCNHETSDNHYIVGKDEVRQALDKAYEAGKEHAYVMATEDINNLTNKDERGN